METAKIKVRLITSTNAGNGDFLLSYVTVLSILLAASDLDFKAYINTYGGGPNMKAACVKQKLPVGMYAGCKECI